MPESEPVTAAAKMPLTPQPPLAGAVIAWQRALLAALATAHVICPFLFWGAAGNDLLLDSILPAQMALFCIALALAGLNKLATAAFLGLSTVAAFGWTLAYPAHLQSYVFMTFVVPLAVLAVALIALRVLGYRGCWNYPTTARSRPFQISIRWLMAMMATVAISLAAATWLRQVPGLGNSASDGPSRLLDVIVDGTCILLLSLSTIGAAGTRGGALLKFAALLSLALYIALFQIYVYHMEALWNLSLFMSTWWLIVITGTLYIWRICGWQVISHAQWNASFNR